MSLRIISGIRRGAKLKAPEGLDTRPLRDRVRESLFSILRSRLRGAVILDAFAGSGAVALEAISNGAARAVFIEPAQPALAVLRENIGKLRFEGECTVLAGSSPGAISGLEAGHPPFDILFLMPSYHSGLCQAVLAHTPLHALLRPGSLAVCEIHAEEELTPPPHWNQVDDRLYGITRLLFLEWSGGDVVTNTLAPVDGGS